MKSLTTVLFILLTLVFSPASFSKELILSANLAMDYPDPTLISHTRSSLIFKYDNWSFVHEVVDPKSIYKSIDLTGIDQVFLISIFDKTKRDSLPSWLAALSKDQAKEFNVTPTSVEKSAIGKAKITSVYDEERQSAQLYIFEELMTHHITVYGSKEKLDLVKRSIKER
ncbi:hypothetical protein [Alkalimarinus coralli]|uniref:hypothetical protein n=1 Tax=Alkalimarinus coralli TaxID=2935863 RepID=UPI00202B4EF0|nr:hypothetical protein [Alkalimarinus coralli]